MGSYLSFINNRAFAVSGSFPDENYAREIMQLFTVGLWQLRSDGTRVKDSNGEDIPTYDIQDIVTLARVWTGFQQQSARQNLETRSGDGATNYVDPMKINPNYRDRFPKTNLWDGNRTVICIHSLRYVRYSFAMALYGIGELVQGGRG